MKDQPNCLIRFSDLVEQFPHIVLNEFLSFNFAKELKNEENERKMQIFMKLYQNLEK